MLRSVLIADPDQDSRDILTAFLGFYGYTTLEAVTGEEALRVIREHGPAVVVTELALPKLDGCDLLRTVREDPSMRHIPVLVITADALPAARERAVAAGCDLFLLKPFNLRRLLEMVLLLGNRDGASAGESGRRAEAEAEAPPELGRAAAR